MDDEDFDEFWVADRLWFIATTPRPTDATLLCKMIADESIDDDDAKLIPIFTDSDLAYRFIKRVFSNRSDLKPFSLLTMKELVAVLLELGKLGYRKLTFDPEPNNGRVFYISRVIKGIAKSRS